MIGTLLRERAIEPVVYEKGGMNIVLSREIRGRVSGQAKARIPRDGGLGVILRATIDKTGATGYLVWLEVGTQTLRIIELEDGMTTLAWASAKLTPGRTVTLRYELAHESVKASVGKVELAADTPHWGEATGVGFAALRCDVARIS